MRALRRVPISVALMFALLVAAACVDEGPDGDRHGVPAAARVLVRRHVRAGGGFDAASVAAADARAAARTAPRESPADAAGLRGRDVGELVALLDTTEGRMRRDVVYELVRHGAADAAFDWLLELVHDDDAAIAVAHALACVRERALPVLRERLAALRGADEDDEDRRFDLEFAIEEIEWLFPPPPVADTREPSCAPPPPSPDVATLRGWLLEESPETRRTGAVAAGEKGEEARELVPLVSAALAARDAVDIDVIAKALRQLGASHEALLVVRARMAGDPEAALYRSMKALAELGEIARDDVVAHAGRVLAEAGYFDRAIAYDALRATGADPAPFRDAIARSLGGEVYERSAAARLLAAHPARAREMREALVRALPEADALRLSRWVSEAILAAGGLPAADALRLLAPGAASELEGLLAAVGPETAKPGDEVALRLWEIVLDGDSDDDADAAVDALERARAIDERDVPRMLDAVERRGLGFIALGEICRSSATGLPRLLELLERGEDVTWPLAMLGPRAAPALPRLVLEARDQDFDAAFAVGAIGAAGVEPLRRALDGQHALLREIVLLDVLEGVHETAEDRSDAELDAACRGYLALLADVPPDRLDVHLAALTAYDDEDVRWAAERLR